MDTVRSVFDEACADFAQVWNRQNSRASVAGHLAPEILTNCFRYTDFASLVQATHVCRRWRALALADRTLRASFRFGSDRDGRHTVSQAIGQLTAMLDRSRPVPFVLQLPRSASREKVRLFTALQPDFWRLQSYVGPLDLYLLNPHGAPMPHITHINFIKEYASSDAKRTDGFAFPPDWGTRGAPNLRRLTASMISIPTVCDPLRALEYLRLNVAGRFDGYRRIFNHCPSLVTLKLIGVLDDTILPTAPLPTSLNTVALHAPEGQSVEFAPLLASWSGQPIPKLTIYGARSLSAAVEFFLSSFQGPVSISKTRNQVSVSLSSAGVVTQASRPQHIIYPFNWRDLNQLHGLRGPCAHRLTSITVPGERLGNFFDAQLTAPHLTRLEFHLDGSTDNNCVIPDMPVQTFHLAAPSLRDVVVCVPFDERSLRFDNWCRSTVAAMCQGLRRLISYDAALLETMKIRGAPEVITLLGCKGLSGYAKAYLENPIPR